MVTSFDGDGLGCGEVTVDLDGGVILGLDSWYTRTRG